jgi:hypothetical protein
LQHLAAFGGQMRILRIVTCSVWYQLRCGILPHLTETNNAVQLIAHLQPLVLNAQLIYNALLAYSIHLALLAHSIHLALLAHSIYLAHFK